MIVFNLIALLLIAGIVYWFWLYTPKQQAAVGDQGVIDVVVDNGVYQPSRIQVPTGKDSVLRFIRKDQSPCAATVLIDDLEISRDLDTDRPTEVTIHPEKPGDYEFTCQMRMYRGTIHAE